MGWVWYIIWHVSGAVARRWSVPAGCKDIRTLQTCHPSGESERSGALLHGSMLSADFPLPCQMVTALGSYQAFRDWSSR